MHHTPSLPFILLQSSPSFPHLLQTHAQIIRRNLAADPFISSKLLQLCASSPHGNLSYAHKLFDQIPQPNIFSWNTLIRAHATSPNPLTALLLFRQMRSFNTAPNSHTFPFALKACARLGAIDLGEQLHGFMVKSNATSDVFSINGLISMYCSCGCVELGEKVFDSGVLRDLATWNCMISGFVDCGLLGRARKVFDEMPERGIVSWNAMINGYVRFGDVGEARELFDEMPERNVESWNTVVAGYARCGRLDMAMKVFDDMPVRNVVSWSAMISACSQGGRPSDALGLFVEMKRVGARPNYAAIVSLLSACSQLGALDMGRKIHSYVDGNKMKIDSVVGTALIDMYSKCGCIDKAFEVFSILQFKDVFSWSAIIGGLAINGHGAKALMLFDEMKRVGVRPNEVTFVGVLCACSHGGLVDLAKHYFDSMRSNYGVEPQSEHYGCLVDALGRAGRLHDAMALMDSAPRKGNLVLWVTLLGASWIHGNLKVAEKAFERLVELKPDDGGVYVILSNIYAMKGMWDKAREVRMLMKSKGLNKEPSRSSIEVNGEVHEFAVGKESHRRLPKIYKMLDEIFMRIRIEGYVPNTMLVFFDVEEEEKENVVVHHSEKLAIAFGLVMICGKEAIRVINNIRVCKDCHTFAKLVSKVYGREIIVRDRNVFHYFRGGSCSCGDYW